jgi:hypothetical protein
MRRFLTTRRHEQVPSCLTGRGRRGTTVNSCLPSCALFLRFVSVASCSLPSFATFGHTTKNGSYMALWAGTLRTQLGLDSADSAELGLYGLSGLYSFVGRSATRGLRCIFEMWGDGGRVGGLRLTSADAELQQHAGTAQTSVQLKPCFLQLSRFALQLQILYGAQGVLLVLSARGWGTEGCAAEGSQAKPATRARLRWLRAARVKGLRPLPSSAGQAGCTRVRL